MPPTSSPSPEDPSPEDDAAALEAAKEARRRAAKKARAKARAMKLRNNLAQDHDLVPADKPGGYDKAVRSDGKAKSIDPKQIRARARKAQGIAVEELTLLYGKPLAEWDEEELAKGRPKDRRGQFSGPTPTWITREVHEEAMGRFKALIQENMRTASIPAIKLVEQMLMNDAVDRRGRPEIPPSVKLDAAKWLVEHLIGKPTQPIKTDLSVKLQAVLGAAVVFSDPSAPQDPHQPATPSAMLAMIAAGDTVDAEIVEDE